MAKFKVGDKVRIANPHVMDRGRVGEIYDTNVDGSPREYLVKLGAEIEEWSESDLAKFEYNTNIATTNSVRNGKFKVGDKVSVKREAAEAIDNPALARKRGRVTKVLPGGYYEIDGELGATGLELTDAELTLANSRVCNSSNTVVRKAANSATSKFKKGDIVLDRNGEWYQVKDIRGDGFIAIRRQSGSWEYRDPKDFKLMNSRAINSANSVVAKALNSKVATNADAGFEELKRSLLTDIGQAENTAVKEIRKVLSKLSDKLDALEKQYMAKVKDPGQRGDIYKLCYLDAKEILDEAWH